MTAGSCSSHPRRLIASVSRSDTAETSVFLAERRLRERLDALGPAPRAGLLHVLMFPEFERVDRIGEFLGLPRKSHLCRATYRLRKRTECFGPCWSGR
jgi:hypothetical protein